MRHGGPEIPGVSISPHGVIEILPQVGRLVMTGGEIMDKFENCLIHRPNAYPLFISPRVLHLGPDFVVVRRAGVVGVREDEGAVHVPQVVGCDVFPDPVWRHELSQLTLQILYEFQVPGSLLHCTTRVINNRPPRASALIIQFISSYLKTMREAVKVHDDDLVGLLQELPHVLNDDVERVHPDEIVH